MDLAASESATVRAAAGQASARAAAGPATAPVGEGPAAKTNAAGPEGELPSPELALLSARKDREAVLLVLLDWLEGDEEMRGEVLARSGRYLNHPDASVRLGAGLAIDHIGFRSVPLP